ncbi:hypothetical protein BVC80_1837g238 [Macleaya cordata]|uniref:Uncharacterized protein n=1 Tax=Macleaya cordata TaxID=56857 RepID=A0A200R3Z1_MACCD|nr:hypothetical protein BVC80_1837g238 [Macleaya cordata]
MELFKVKRIIHLLLLTLLAILLLSTSMAFAIEDPEEEAGRGFRGRPPRSPPPPPVAAPPTTPA